MGWLNTSNEVTSVMLEISSAQIQKSLNAWIEAVRYFNLLRLTTIRITHR